MDTNSKFKIQNSQLPPWPLVSVIMPVRDEAAFIARSLGAVLAQDYPADRLEIIVVDDGSTDGTPEAIAALPGAERVRVLRLEGGLIAAALNAGIRVAQGEFIARVDGHTIIAPDYVRRCVAHLQATGADNVGGLMRPVGLTPEGEAIAAAMSFPFGLPARFHYDEHAQDVDTVYLGAWPRAVFERVGLFNEGLAINEDYELNYRIRRAGGRIFLAPDVRSDYYGRQTVIRLAQQQFNYGQWKARMIRLHPRSIRPRHLAAPLLVLGLAGLGLGSLIAVWPRPILAALIGLYAAATLAASLWIAARRGWRLLAWLPVIFATLHLAWGSGFWRGLFIPPGK